MLKRPDKKGYPTLHPDFMTTQDAPPEEPKTLTWGFRLILIASALFIAGCSAFFSVRGLGLLFVGSEIPVMVMAASLEIGKLVAASFLYRYWDQVNGALRFYLTLAVVLLIGITSLGNYGYLARAYEKTTTQIQRNELEIASLEKEIVEVQHRIDDSRGRNNRLSTASREDLIKAQSRLTQANDALTAALARLQEKRRSIDARRAADVTAPTQRVGLRSATLAKSIAAEEASVAGLNERIKVLDQAVSAYTAQGTTSQFLFFDKDNVRKGQELRVEQKPERDVIAAKLAESATRIERLRAEQARLDADSGKEVSGLRQQFAEEHTRVDAEEKELRKASAATIVDLERQLAGLQEQGQGKVTISDAEIEKLHKTVSERNKQIHDLRDQIAAADIGSYRFVARAFEAEADDVVKWLMLALVAVFDPLAVTLVVAFNMAVQGRRKSPFAVESAAKGSHSKGSRPWSKAELTIIAILAAALALLVAWVWTSESSAPVRRTSVGNIGAIPGDSFAVMTLRPDELRQKSTKAFPEWLERAGGKGMSAAFAELLKNGLDAHSEIQVFAKFPGAGGNSATVEHPAILCGAVFRVTNPAMAEAALSRIADQMNEAVRGDSRRPPSNLTRNRAMIKHGEGRYMDPEGGFFTFGLTNRTAIILVEFEGNPRAPSVEQEIRQCLLHPDQRTLRAGEKAHERLPSYVGEQSGALTLWLDASRFFHRLPMSPATRRNFEQLQPSLDFEMLLSLDASGNDSLVLGGKYLYRFDRFAEGSPRPPLAILAKISPPKEADLAWKLINRGVDTLDFESMVERMRGALGDDRSPLTRRVVVEKSIPSAREAKFTMNARFDPKAGPPLIAAMSLLAP